MEEMNEITQPTDEEKADFPLNVHWAGWAIWDDSENEDLAKWIETSNWSGMKDEEPCGWVIGAEIDLTNAPNDQDFYVAGLSFNDYDVTMSAYMEKTSDGITFKSLSGKLEDVPKENGLAEKFVASDDNLMKSDGNFEGQSGGLQNEFGQAFDDTALEWTAWNWSTSEEDIWYGNYTAWVGQYDSNSDQYFVFTDTLAMEQNGATTLTAVSLATTAFFALF